jgi:UDPglucose--hexose-1-phosphate uridylyltransferase
MSALRQNFFTKEWVIIATERSKRSEELATKRPAETVPSFVEACLFCPGNESKAPVGGHALSGEYQRALGSSSLSQQVSSTLVRSSSHAQRETLVALCRGIRFPRSHRRRSRPLLYRSVAGCAGCQNTSCLQGTLERTERRSPHRSGHHIQESRSRGRSQPAPPRTPS